MLEALTSCGGGGGSGLYSAAAAAAPAAAVDVVGIAAEAGDKWVLDRGETGEMANIWSVGDGVRIRVPDGAPVSLIGGCGLGVRAVAAPLAAAAALVATRAPPMLSRGLGPGPLEINLVNGPDIRWTNGDFRNLNKRKAKMARRARRLTVPSQLVQEV